jgi:hypothetical protein
MKKELCFLTLILALAGGSAFADGAENDKTTTAITSTTVAAKNPQEVPCTYEKLKLKTGEVFLVEQKFDFKNRDVNDARYQKMYGGPYIRMVQQMIIVNGVKGGLTFTEFSDATKNSAYESAVKYWLSSDLKRKAKIMAFGNFVLTLQVADDNRLEELSKFVQDQLLKNIQ